MEEESYVVDYNNYVKDDNVVIVIVVVFGRQTSYILYLGFIY